MFENAYRGDESRFNYSYQVVNENGTLTDTKRIKDVILYEDFSSHKHISYSKDGYLNDWPIGFLD